MPLELSSRTYSDLNPDPRAETALVTEVQSVYLSLENYFRTRKRERLFRPPLGGSVEEWLWELAIDGEGANLLLGQIVTDLRSAEPRVTVVPAKSSVVADPENYRYRITIAFYISGLGDNVYNFDGYLIKKRI